MWFHPIRKLVEIHAYKISLHSSLRIGQLRVLVFRILQLEKYTHCQKWFHLRRKRVNSFVHRIQHYHTLHQPRVNLPSRAFRWWLLKRLWKVKVSFFSFSEGFFVFSSFDSMMDHSDRAAYIVLKIARGVENDSRAGWCILTFSIGLDSDYVKTSRRDVTELHVRWNSLAHYVTVCVITYNRVILHFSTELFFLQ